MRGHLWWIAPASVLMLGVLLGRPSEAIPAFARKHEFSCTTCHDPFPRLKPYGEEFAANAYAPSDQEMPPRYYTDVGDDRLSLFREIPLAFRGDFYLDFQLNGNDNGDGYQDFKTPWVLKLLSGGRLGPDIGYYFYFMMTEGGEIVGLEDTVIQFNDLFESPIDLLVGQFQVSDVLFKRETRLTFQDYLPFKIRPGRSDIDLTYDRGFLVSADFSFGLMASLSLTNGARLGAAIDDNLDPDYFKNVMLRLSQELGPARVGAFGFFGKERRTITDETTGASHVGTNEAFMWGADVTLDLNRTTLNALYLQRRDINPYLKPANEPFALKSHGIMAEAVTRLWGNPGRLYAVLLFDKVESQVPGADQESYTGNLTYLLRTNLKLMAEYTFYRIHDDEVANEHRILLGLTGAI